MNYQSNEFLKKEIESNKKIILEQLTCRCAKISSLHWIPSKLQTETSNLFKIPNNIPAQQRDYYIDYANIQNIAKTWTHLANLPKSTNIDIIQIQHIHKRLATGTNIPAGQFRFSAVALDLLDIEIPSFEKVPYLLDDITYQLQNNSVNAINRALQAHCSIIAAQPVNDFNKRVARMTMNWFLLKNNYTPIIFDKPTDKKLYYENLKNYYKGDIHSYNNYMYICMLRTQQTIIKLLKNSLTL
ncbi:MAG: Fic family protein [Alphaproteobacteria bacterium]|nr:Fic family protein [Alphaproteobacteria bacterium]